MVGDRRRLRFRVLFAVYFLSYSGVNVFRNAYLEDLGMTGTQMGVVGFVFVVVGVMAQPGWGLVTDWRGTPRTALELGAVGSGVALLSYPLGGLTSHTFAVVVVGTAVFSVFHAPIVPVANALVLSEGLEYGRVRAFGSVAFGVGSVCVGLLLTAVDTAVVVALYAGGMCVVVALVHGGGARTERPSLSADLSRDVRALFANGRFGLLVGVAVLVGFSSQSASAFFSVYVRVLGPGDTFTGIAWGVKTVFEAVTFLFLFRVGGSYRTLLVAGCTLSALPSLAYALTTDPAVVLAVQAFAGIGYATYYLVVVELAHALAPASLASTAQTVVLAIGLGGGGAVGQLVAGGVVDRLGLREMYALLAAAALAAAIVAVFVGGGDGPGTKPAG